MAIQVTAGPLPAAVALGLGGKAGAFAEAGGYGFGLKADSRTVGRLQTGLGLRAERGWNLANGMRMQFDGSAAVKNTTEAIALLTAAEDEIERLERLADERDRRRKP